MANHHVVASQKVKGLRPIQCWEVAYGAAQPEKVAGLRGRGQGDPWSGVEFPQGVDDGMTGGKKPNMMKPFGMFLFDCFFGTCHLGWLGFGFFYTFGHFSLDF